MSTKQEISSDERQKIVDYLLSLKRADGSYRASRAKTKESYPAFVLDDFDSKYQVLHKNDYFGIADSVVSDFAASVYVAELALTLGYELTDTEKTEAFIRKHQHPDGYFSSLEIYPDNYDAKHFYIYNTCIGIRGLKALGRSPQYDPRHFLNEQIRKKIANMPNEPYYKFSPYWPDMFANAYAAFEEEMPEDCKDILSEKLTTRQDPETGWFYHSSKDGWKERYRKTNPAAFHAARFFHLIDRDVPMADKILDTFMDVQEDDGSWKIGGVHGTFDACVTLRMLGDDSDKYRKAIRRAAGWALTCQNEDGGFSHFGKSQPKLRQESAINLPSEVDACYFQIATLVMAGLLETDIEPSNRWIGWGHTLINESNAKNGNV